MTRQRDPRITLFNIKRAGGRIEGYIDGQDYTAYVESVGLQDQLERNFITIGEVLNQLEKISPELARRIPDARVIIGFRHILVHDYDDIDTDAVWYAAVNDFPKLLDTVQELLTELDLAEHAAGNNATTPTEPDSGPSPF